MVKAAALVAEFINDKTLADFIADQLLQSAVERQLEILGEAAAHISAETRREWPSIEWQSIKDFRNLLAHEYFRTDSAKVWNTAHNLLPIIRLLLEEVLADLEQKYGPEDDV